MSRTNSPKGEFQIEIEILDLESGVPPELNLFFIRCPYRTEKS